MLKKYEFPEDFVWGVAMAAQQIEGAGRKILSFLLH